MPRIRRTLWWHIRYRWEMRQAPFPETPGVQVVFSASEERERHEVLQRLRGLLGYGPGWTFREALCDWLCEKALLFLLALLILIMLYHAP